MAASDVIFRVRANLVPRELGGPSSPVRSGYEAHVWLGDFTADRGRVTHVAELTWEGVDEIAPGGGGIGRLRPATPEDWDAVDTGARLELYEGGHVMCRALVVEVLEAGGS